MHVQARRRLRARGMGFLGQSSATAELEKIRAERAQVEAEIRRLESGGAPMAGGFQAAPALPAAASIAPVAASIQPFQIPSFSKLPSWVVPAAGVVGLIGLGWIFLGKRSG